MSFIKLVYKEIKGSRLVSMLFIALVVLWHIILLTRMEVWGEEIVLGLVWMPAFVLPLWVLGNMFQILHTEWSTNSIYLLLSLPQRGWKILGAKWIANVIDFLILGILSLLSILLFFGIRIMEFIERHNPGVPLKLFIIVGLQLIFYYLLAVMILMVLVQFAYITGRMVERFKGLVAGVTVFVGLWLYARLGVLLAPLFEWVPDMGIRTWYVTGNVVHLGMEKINSAPLASVVLLTFLLFIFGAWLFDRYIEV